MSKDQCEKISRSFRIVAVSQDDGIDFEKGTYHGRGPGQAALKAFNWYCRNAKLSACRRRFTLEEITRGSDRKQFHYVGSRKKLEVPKKIERLGGVSYSVEYQSTVLKAS